MYGITDEMDLIKARARRFITWHATLRECHRRCFHSCNSPLFCIQLHVNLGRLHDCIACRDIADEGFFYLFVDLLPRTPHILHSVALSCFWLTPRCDDATVLWTDGSQLHWQSLLRGKYVEWDMPENSVWAHQFLQHPTVRVRMVPHCLTSWSIWKAGMWLRDYACRCTRTNF